MGGSKVFAVVFNDQDVGRVANAIRRACAHCGRSGRALVLEFIVGMALDGLWEALIEGAEAESAPLVIALVVAQHHLAKARTVGQVLADQGVMMAGFTNRAKAMHYAEREASLALSESLSSSASSASSVWSICA